MAMIKPEPTPGELGITLKLIELVSTRRLLFPEVIEGLAGVPPHMNLNTARRCRGALVAGEALLGLMSVIPALNKAELLNQDIYLDDQADPELVWQS